LLESRTKSGIVENMSESKMKSKKIVSVSSTGGYGCDDILSIQSMANPF
jgi:hypothetical protein